MNLDRQRAHELAQTMQKSGQKLANALKPFNGNKDVPVMIIAHVSGKAQLVGNTDRAMAKQLVEDLLASWRNTPNDNDDK